MGGGSDLGGNFHEFLEDLGNVLVATAGEYSGHPLQHGVNKVIPKLINQVYHDGVHSGFICLSPRHN